MIFAGPVLVLALAWQFDGQRVELKIPQAWAQSGGRIKEARAHMERGQALFAQGKYGEALKAFDAAYAESPFAAFIFNQAVCLEKMGEYSRAVTAFERYLRADPSSPDAEAVKKRIEDLKRKAAAPPPSASVSASGSASAAPPPPKPPPSPADIKSLVFIESDPPGAPVEVWRRNKGSQAAFSEQSPAWHRFGSATTPHGLTVAPGHFHIVVKKWRSYNRSETSLDVEPGHVHHFKANLSQGAFMAFVRVDIPNKKAAIYFDQKPGAKRRRKWGTSPHSELVPSGKHTFYVEAPGFKPLVKVVNLAPGQRISITTPLNRVNVGHLRVSGNASQIRIQIDGQPVGVYNSGDGPLKLEEAAGEHTIRAEADGKKAYEAKIKLAPGQFRDVKLVLLRKYPRGKAWFYAISSAALLGGGFILDSQADSIHDDLLADRRAGRLGADDGRATRGKYFAYGSTAAYGMGGLFALLATYEFLRDPFPPSGARVSEPRDWDAPAPKVDAPGPKKRKIGIFPGYSPLTGVTSLQIVGQFLWRLSLRKSLGATSSGLALGWWWPASVAGSLVASGPASTTSWKSPR